MSDDAVEIQFNVLNHHLVPLHERLDEEEAQEVLRSYQVTKDQLPKVYDTDPAIKVIAAKPGEIVRVTRNSPTAGRAVAYRLVVQGF